MRFFFIQTSLVFVLLFSKIHLRILLRKTKVAFKKIQRLLLFVSIQLSGIHFA